MKLIKVRKWNICLSVGNAGNKNDHTTLSAILGLPNHEVLEKVDDLQQEVKENETKLREKEEDPQENRSKLQKKIRRN